MRKIKNYCHTKLDLVSMYVRSTLCKSQKAAMFRLGTKIKKYCHAELVSVSSIFCKRAAMFGLDARIALAIFGALSVITGAALFSAVKQAKVTAFIADMKELEKAVESYILDTGLHLESQKGDIAILKGSDLVENSGVKGWQGPYLSIKASGMNLQHPKYGVIGISKSGTDSGEFSFMSCKLIDSPCYYWLGMSVNDYINLDFAKNLEFKIDGTKNPGDTNLKGKIVYTFDEYDSFLFIKTDIPYPL